MLWTGKMVGVIDVDHPSLSKHHILCLYPELACLCLDSRSLTVFIKLAFFLHKQNKK